MARCHVRYGLNASHLLEDACALERAESKLPVFTQPAGKQPAGRRDQQRVRAAARDLLQQLGGEVRLHDLFRLKVLVRKDWCIGHKARASLAVVCVAPVDVSCEVGALRAGLGHAC